MIKIVVKSVSNVHVATELWPLWNRKDSNKITRTEQLYLRATTQFMKLQC